MDRARSRQEAACIVGLGDLPDDERGRALAAALRDDPEHDVRLAAARGLRRLPTALLAEHAAALVWAAADRVRLVQCSGAPPTATGPLLSGPQDTEWQVREAAVHALGFVSATAPAVSETVARALHDRSAAVREAAAAALRRLGPAAAEPLLALLEQAPDSRTRRAAASGLRVLGVTARAAVARAPRNIGAALQDCTKELRHTTAEALLETGFPPNVAVPRNVRLAQPPVLPWAPMPSGALASPPLTWTARITGARPRRHSWEP